MCLVLQPGALLVAVSLYAMKQVRLRLEAAIRLIRVIWGSSRHDSLSEMVVVRLSRFKLGGKNPSKKDLILTVGRAP